MPGRRALVCLAVLLFSAAVTAGDFQVSPLKLVFEGKNSTAVLKLTNKGKRPVTVQLEAARWFQNSEGEDRFEETGALVFFPKIVKVAAASEQVIRIGYRGQSSPPSEGTYRLFAQELPELGQADGALNFALRFSVPVFVKPAKRRDRFFLTSVSLENGRALAQVKNEGSIHLLVKRMEVIGRGRREREVFRGDRGGWYVLPDSARTFELKVHEAGCRLSRFLEVAVEIGKDRLMKKVPVDIAQCVNLAGELETPPAP